MKRKGRLISIIAAVLVGLALLSPYLFALIAERVMVAQGFGFASIERLVIHPLDGRIELHGLHAGRTGVEQLRLERLELSLETSALLQRHIHIEHITLQGLRMSLQRFHDGGLNIGGLLVPLSEESSPSSDKPWSLQLGTLELHDQHIDISHPQLRAQLRIDDGAVSGFLPTGLAINGAINGAPLHLHGELNDLSPSLRLKVELKDLVIERLLPRLSLEHYQGRLSLEGEVSIDGLSNIAYQGRFGLEEIAVVHQGLNLEFAGLDVEGIQLPNLNELTIRAIDLKSPRMQLALDREGRPRLPVIAGKEGESSEPPKILLGPLSISDLQLAFSDESVTPPFAERLIIDEFNLSGIDNQDSEAESTLQLKGRIGDFALITLDAHLSPFSDKVNLGGELEIKQLELPPLSPYLAGLLGYQFENGQLEQKLNISIDDNQMQGKAEIRLSNLDVDEAVQLSEGSLKAKMEVPLGTALALLRDNDDNITLEVPFKGDIASPEFDAGDVVNTALAKALKVGGIGYLKLALQPYGTALSLLQMAGKALKHIPLDPVNYAAAESDPGAAEAAYLQKLATLMNEREGLRLRLCGIATASDRQALKERSKDKKAEISNEQLRALAAERGRALKKRLVDEYGIDAGRLFLCHPEIDENSDAIGRVEIGI